MRKYLFLLISIVFGSLNSYATTTISVGASRDYSTIAAAYAACSTATDYVIEIYNDYSYSGETGGTASISLGSLASKSASNTVIIRPASGQSLSFSGTATSIFYLDAANWVIFDGRAGGIGVSAWTITNTNSGASKSIFTFINDASNNVIKYCLLKGDCSSAGLILFSTTTGTTGNDNNTIDNCTIRENSTKPYRLIQSIGTAAKTNSGNIVSNCNLINFQTAGVSLESNTTTWSITNNHFYQTSSLTLVTLNHFFIYVNDGNGYTVTGNYLGGQTTSCGGSAYAVSSTSVAAGTGLVYAIFFSNSTTGSTNVINTNIISNWNITTAVTPFDARPSAVAAIRVEGAASFTIGSSGNGNTIGATSGTGNIVVNHNLSTGSYGFIGVSVNTDATTSVAYNTIGSIRMYQNSGFIGSNCSLIYVASGFSNASGDITIDNNTLGNATTDNIEIRSNSTELVGVQLKGTRMANITVSNNTLQNFTTNNLAGGQEGKLKGISFKDPLASTLSTFTIHHNTIKTLTYNVSSPLDNGGGIQSGDYTAAAVVGIYIFELGYAGDISSFNIYKNYISQLSSSYTGTNKIHVVGILHFTDVDGTFNSYQNKIKQLSNASSSDEATIIGINAQNFGVVTSKIYNNVVLMADSYNTTSKSVYGIYLTPTGVGGSDEVYFNTVRMETTYSSGTGITASLLVMPWADPAGITVKNNVFQNLTTGGTGGHYAQYWDITYLGGLPTTDIRNNYNEAPNASKLVNWGGTDKTLATWRTAISDGSNTELTGTISISSTTGVASSSSIIGSAGTPIGGITTDYDLNSRDATHPWMGAFETIIPLPIELLEISAKCQKSKMSNSEYGGTIRWTTATEKDSDYYIIEKSLDGFVWENLDTIDGSGTKYDPTNYYYHDYFINPTPENETVVYYRVSQTDFDGVREEYDILSCKCEASDKIKIHPVPSTEYIVINFGDQNNVPNTFQVTDMFGKIVQDVTVVGDKANNTSYKLDISNYSSGRYIIKINDWKMKEDAVFIKK